jgi:HK97 family phage major capsid protein
MATSIDDLQSLQTAGALHVAETIKFVGDGDKTAAHDRVENVLRADDNAEFARRVILTANPGYDRAFGKALMRGRDSLSSQEDGLIRAAITESGLGSETPVPITIDPTVLITSNGQTNPLRAVADVRTITGKTWRGITSGGITAAYESSESAEVADGSPTFGGTDISVLRVDAYVPFSIEVDMDWPQFRAEIAKEFADAKDVLEGAKFFTGTGTNEPTGLITALTAATALVKTATTAVFAYTDPKIASNALPVRWDAAAQWFAAKSTWATLEDLLAAVGNADPFSFVQGGGASPSQTVGGGNVGMTYRGYGMNYASAMDTATTTSGKNIMVIGDPKAFTIVDRIGMNVELVPLVIGASQRPIGQRGLYAYWRNNTNVKTVNAFEVLQVR